MNLFLVVAAWVALIATVSVSAKDQQGLRGGQHRALEVHNEQPEEEAAAAAAEYVYFEGSEEEEEFLSLEEKEEMGLDVAEDRDLAYNGYGNGNGGGDSRLWMRGGVNPNFVSADLPRRVITPRGGGYSR